MKTISILLLCLCTSAAYSADKWPRSVISEEATYQVLHLADTLQTLDIKHHPNIHEGSMSESYGSSAIIGEHPSDAQVIGLMAVEAVAHYAITRAMIKHDAPHWIVHAWQLTTITIQGNVVKNNYKLGLKFNF